MTSESLPVLGHPECYRARSRSARSHCLTSARHTQWRPRRPVSSPPHRRAAVRCLWYATDILAWGRKVIVHYTRSVKLSTSVDIRWIVGVSSYVVRPFCASCLVLAHKVCKEFRLVHTPRSYVQTFDKLWSRITVHFRC